MAQLKYTLDLNLKAYPNELTPDVDNDYTVKVHTQSTPLTQDDIADSVAERLAEEPAKVRSILNIFFEEVGLAVASGYCVSTDAFYARPVATGVVLESELSQPVDRDEVRVYASFRQGPAVTEALQRAKLQYFLQPAATGPYIAGMTSALVDAQTKTPVPLAASEMVVLTGNADGQRPEAGGRRPHGGHHPHLRQQPRHLVLHPRIACLAQPAQEAAVRAARRRHRGRMDGAGHHPILFRRLSDQGAAHLLPAASHHGRRSDRTHAARRWGRG